VPVLTPEEEHEMEQSRRESIRREGIEVIAHDYLESIEHEQGKQTKTLKEILENQLAQTGTLREIRDGLIVTVLVIVLLGLWRHC